MKKFSMILTILVCILLVSVTVFAAPSDAKHENIGDLYQDWETNGYPDYVGLVFSTDGSPDNLTVLLTENDGVAESHIRNLLVNDSGLSFGIAKYSYNELMTIADEIVSDYFGKREGFYSVGVGWTSSDGKVVGFGDSGKESRVLVGVDQSIFAEYTEQFANLYGDAVVVEASNAPVLDIAEDSGRRGFPLIGFMILLVVIVIFFNRSRLIPTVQTTKGSVVAQSATVSKKTDGRSSQED